MTSWIALCIIGDSLAVVIGVLVARIAPFTVAVGVALSVKAVFHGLIPVPQAATGRSRIVRSLGGSLLALPVSIVATAILFLAVGRVAGSWLQWQSGAGVLLVAAFAVAIVNGRLGGAWLKPRRALEARGAASRLATLVARSATAFTASVVLLDVLAVTTAVGLTLSTRRASAARAWDPTPVFGASVILDSATLRTSSLSTGDVDGDARPDVLFGNGRHGAAPNHVFLSAPDGSFRFGGDFGTGRDLTYSVPLADIDGDGKLDVIVGNAFGEPSRIHLGTGAGSFGAGRELQGSRSVATRSVAVTDLDDDGDMDVILGNRGYRDLVYINAGAGRFQPPALLDERPRPTVFLAAGDLDGDGYPDVVAARTMGQDAVYWNDGDGRFSASTPLGDGGDDSLSADLGDLDGDGLLDIVMGRSNDRNLAYLNGGGRRFRTGLPIGDARVTHTELFGLTLLGMMGIIGGGHEASTRPVLVGDMDGDGDLDVVVGNVWQQNLVYLNDGSAVFPHALAFGTGRDATRALALLDVDGDGDLDLLSGNNSEPNTLTLNPGPAAFAAR